MNVNLHLLNRMPGGEKEVHKRTIKDQVADKLAYMIQTGLLQISDELPSERELATTLEVSRESIRAAIGVLSARGMVDVSQGSRTRVLGLGGMSFAESMGALSSLRNKSVAEVTEAREEVEKQILKLTAKRINKADLKRLDLLVQQQKHMTYDPVAFQISDREFHTVVYAACGNSLLSDFASDLYDYALDLRRLALRKEGTIAQSVLDHQGIVHALSQADPMKAECAILNHLEHIHATTVQEMSTRKPRRAEKSS